MDPLSALSSELILRIAGFLDDAHDVVRLRAVNRRLNILATDPLIWKRLFMDTFLLDKDAHLDVVDTRLRKRARRMSTSQRRSSLAKASGSEPMSAGRVVSLPRFQREGDSDVEDGVDWYRLYKISSNWQTGFYSSQQLHTTIDVESEQPLPPRPQSTEGVAQENALTFFAPHDGLPDTIVEPTSDFVFTASRYSSNGSASGNVLVFPTRIAQPSGTQDALASMPHDATNGRVSALAADRNADAVRPGLQRLLVVYNDGALRLVTFDKRSLRFDGGPVHPAPRCNSDETMMAAFHWPYIVTCTESFRMRIYNVDERLHRIRLLSERRSHSCHWPACLRLAPISNGGSNVFRVSIAYTNAVYPSGWSVSLQETIINDAGVVESRSACAKRFRSANHLLGPPLSNGTPKETSNATTRSSAVERLTSLTYEFPYIVVGSRDNSAFCFSVEQNSSSLAIRHLRTLHGHTGSVHSVSLDGGKCVTGGGDGSVRVWQLGDEQESIARAAGLRMGVQLKQAKGTVVTLRLPGHDDDRNSSLQPSGSGTTFGPLPSSSSSLKRKRSEIVPLTLSDILRRATPSLSAVRWVASAFDRIVSVSGSPVTDVRRNCGMEAAKEHDPAASLHRDEEVVQIWNFAA